MNHVFPTAAISALFLGLACSPSSATTVGPTTITFGSDPKTALFSGTAQGPTATSTGMSIFSDVFNVIFTNPDDTSIKFTSAFTGAQKGTTFTSFSLSDGTHTYSDNAIQKTSSGASGSIVIADLMAGTYTLTIAGKGVGTPVRGGGFSYPTYGGSISVSPVPLPASLPMFGAALLGLGAFGYSKKRKAGAAAAAA